MKKDIGEVDMISEEELSLKDLEGINSEEFKLGDFEGINIISKVTATSDSKDDIVQVNDIKEVSMIDLEGINIEEV